ncbi:MAG: reverse transcriptase domain-containing protein, partial [Clostridium sp.]|uniref:reverse transcriptase domain-containing protein n=1 Tax=Clostridium sp. TaxID=1506 RepID=UPI003F3D79B6
DIATYLQQFNQIHPETTTFREHLENVRKELDPVLIPLLGDYADIFPDKFPRMIPTTQCVDMNITTIPGKIPPKGFRYKHSARDWDILKAHIEELLEAEQIAISHTPYAAPCFCVSKKTDGDTIKGKNDARVVIDYRELNRITIAPDFPPPNIQQVLEMLRGARVFSALDLARGFHQIRIAPEDQHKTAFHTPFGQYEFRVMPFGLKGSPSIFQTVMNQVFFDLLGKCVVVYMDDVLIYSKTRELHLEHLASVFKRLREVRLYCKFVKCKFMTDKIEYVGYTITPDGVIPSRSKINEISILPEILENVTQVRQFLGIVNYCRMFMGPDFAQIAAPLTRLTKKNVEFSWLPEHTIAVQTLKQRLAEYVTLALPDSTQPFVLKTDASATGIGATLEQNGKPVAFMSHVLVGPQLAYPAYDLELLALITALQRWQHLLREAPEIRLLTDHQPLQYLLRSSTTQPVRSRTAKWLSFLSEFPHLTIDYLPGKKNIAADALSRLPLKDKLLPAPILLAITRGQTRKEFPSENDDQARRNYYQKRFGKDFDILDETENKPLSKRKRRREEWKKRNVITTTIDQNPSSSRSSSTPNPLPSATPLDPTTGDDPPTVLPENENTSAIDSRTTGLPRIDKENSEKEITGIVIGDENWFKALIKSEKWGPILKVLKHQRIHRYKTNRGKLIEEYLLHGNYLKQRCETLWRICVPDDDLYRVHIIYAHHDILTAGHPGEKKTYQAVSRCYVWPGMKKYITNYVASCVRCQTSKRISQKSAGLLQPLQIPSRRWDQISMDFVTNLPVSKQGNDSVLVVIDMLSKMAHLIPCKNTISA